MDLNHTQIYQLLELGIFLNPHNNMDLARLADVFEKLIIMKIKSTLPL